MRAFLDTDTVPKARPRPQFPHDGEGFAIFRATQLSTPPETLGRAYRVLARTDLAPRVARLPCPALFVAATHDIARPPAQIAARARRVPAARSAR